MWHLEGIWGIPNMITFGILGFAPKLRKKPMLVGAPGGPPGPRPGPSRCRCSAVGARRRSCPCAAGRRLLLTQTGDYRNCELLHVSYLLHCGEGLTRTGCTLMRVEESSPGAVEMEYRPCAQPRQPLTARIRSSSRRCRLGSTAAAPPLLGQRTAKVQRTLKYADICDAAALDDPSAVTRAL